MLFNSTTLFFIYLLHKELTNVGLKNVRLSYINAGKIAYNVRANTRVLMLKKISTI